METKTEQVMESPSKGSKGKLHLTIKTARVSREAVFNGPHLTLYGDLGASPRRGTVYDYVLDDEQAKTLKLAKELAERSGLELQVTDVTRENAVKRLLRSGSSLLGRN